MRILVTGANGFIGSHLVPYLTARGHHVTTLPRSGDGTSFDLEGFSHWPDWPEATDAVVHLAALNPTRQDAASRDVGALHRVNVEGTRILAERAAAEGVSRFVFLSTANVHRPNGLVAVSETDEPHPQSAYAASKLAAEAVLRQVSAQTGMACCTLRPAPVYGKGARGALSTLARVARLPVPLPLKDLSRRRSVLGIENGLDAILAALTHPQAEGGTFLAADSGTVSVGELIAAARAGLGRPAMLVPFPAGAVKLAAGLLRRSNDFERLFGSFVVDTGRIEDRLGWKPSSSSIEGVGRMMRA